jgi:hypothetical protein
MAVQLPQNWALSSESAQYTPNKPFHLDWYVANIRHILLDFLGGSNDFVSQRARRTSTAS